MVFEFNLCVCATHTHELGTSRCIHGRGEDSYFNSSDSYIICVQVKQIKLLQVIDIRV